MSTENKNTPMTNSEADSQGRCAVAAGSAFLIREINDLLCRKNAIGVSADEIAAVVAREIPQEARRWKDCADDLAMPHYILIPELRAEKLRDALAKHKVLTRAGLPNIASQPTPSLT